MAGEHSRGESDECLELSSPKIFPPANPPVAGALISEGLELAVSNFLLPGLRESCEG